MTLLRQRQPGIVSMILTDEESLRVESKKVGFVTDNVREIVQQMQEAALDWEIAHPKEVAVAMAAPQIGQRYKILIVRADPISKTKEFNVYLNPKITKLEGEVVHVMEGCLSIPGVYAEVARHSKVRCRANNLEGRMVKFRAEGLMARVLQHEIDHFHGKLFTDLVARKDWKRLEDLVKS